MLTYSDFNITITYTTQALVILTEFYQTSLVVHKREMTFSKNENFCSAIDLLKQAAYKKLWDNSSLSYTWPK